MIFHVLIDSFLLVFQISDKLKILGLESDSEITWRKEEGEEVFHEEIIHVVNSNNACNSNH